MLRPSLRDVLPIIAAVSYSMQYMLLFPVSQSSCLVVHWCVYAGQKVLRTSNHFAYPDRHPMKDA